MNESWEEHLAEFGKHYATRYHAYFSGENGVRYKKFEFIKKREGRSTFVVKETRFFGEEDEFETIQTMESYVFIDLATSLQDAHKRLTGEDLRFKFSTEDFPEDILSIIDNVLLGSE